jgi:hypothetical protein
MMNGIGEKQNIELDVNDEEGIEDIEEVEKLHKKTEESILVVEEYTDDRFKHINKMKSEMMKINLNIKKV